MMHENKKNTRKSAAKKFLNGYIKSGDIYGHEGLNDLGERRNFLAHHSLHDDAEKLKEDWITIGEEIESAMYKYDKEIHREWVKSHEII